MERIFPLCGDLSLHFDCELTAADHRLILFLRYRQYAVRGPAGRAGAPFPLPRERAGGWNPFSASLDSSAREPADLRRRSLGCLWRDPLFNRLRGPLLPQGDRQGSLGRNPCGAGRAGRLLSGVLAGDSPFSCRFPGDHPELCGLSGCFEADQPKGGTRCGCPLE